MNPEPFTTDCKTIFARAKKSIPASYQAQIICDELAASDKGDRETLMFSVWGKDPLGFWHRGYCSYSIVHDPYKLLSENVPFQVRFVYFHNRKETSLGRFNKSVHSTLTALDGQHGFVFAENHKTFRVYRSCNNPIVTPQWRRSATADLAWLMAWTLPAFGQMLAS